MEEAGGLTSLLFYLSRKLLLRHPSGFLAVAEHWPPSIAGKC
jgi:hypothetical protein